MIPPARLADGFPGERLTILPAPVVRRARTLPVCRDLCVTHLGRFDRARGHYVSRPRGRPEHVLILCLAGAGRVHVAGTTHHLHAGGGIVLPPGRSHRYAADPDDPWTIFWFHFTGRRAGDYLNALRLTRRKSVFRVKEVDAVVEAFEDCYRQVLGGYTDGELTALTTSFARLLGLCRMLQRSDNARRHHSEERVLRTLRFMRSNLSRPVTLGELAGQASLSVPHFSALFQRQMRCPPMEFLIRLRMQRACELLISSDQPAHEIAAAIGYEDPFYFSRLFRKKVGISAREYRRNAEKPR